MSLDDVTDDVLRRVATGERAEAAYVRRAIIAQAERDEQRLERNLAREIEELRTRVAELERLIGPGG